MKYFAILFLVLFSCSPVKRFNRLVERHPELLTKDTIIQIDTIKFEVPKVEYKDAFITQPIDTIEIEKERLKIKIIRKYDTLEVEGKCDTVTVTEIVERKIPVRYYKSEEFNWKKWLFWIIIGIIVYIAYRNYKK